MRIYLDNNATTPLDPEVLGAMTPFLVEKFGNPNSVHAWGREARQALEQARAIIGQALGATDRDSIVFTSGGTEGDNLALMGTAAARAEAGRHLIVSCVEHHAVLNTARHLGRQGFEVTYLPVDSQGLLDPGDVSRAIRPDTILVSLMHGNNETGVLFPIASVGRLCRERGVTFHTDAVQSFGKVPLDVENLHVDLLSLSGHKIHGPKGIGALYIRRGTRMQPLLYGGMQERSRRAGTENVAGAVGLARATEIALLDRDGTAQRMGALRDQLERDVMTALPDVHRNGHPTQRLPHTTNLAFAGVEAESLILALDLAGIAISSGAACTSGAMEASHVLTAMGLPRERVMSSVRLSLGRTTTRQEIAVALETILEIVVQIRRVNGTPLSAVGVRGA